jgi:glutathione synthase/RimK-type ligase-like ATP-grasp enzyme/ribosomal protein S18 acetylase RimI-like enzyme
MPSIRPAKPGDVQALAAIERDSFSHDLISARSLREAVRNDKRILLVAADDEDRPIGYALVHFRRDAGHARLYSIAVARDKRSLGVGRNLLAAAEAEAAIRRQPKIRLEVKRDDAATVAFYERHGYSARKVIAGYYENGSDAILMEKVLRFDEALSPFAQNRPQIAIVTGRAQDGKALAATAARLNARLLTASEYLSQPTASEGVKQVINLCPVDEYLSQGYYVSLLAKARAQRAIPNIDTVTGLIWKKLYRNFLGELGQLVKGKVPADAKPDKEGNLAIEVHFGEAREPWAKALASRAWRLFPAPVLEIALVRKARGWEPAYIWPLSIAAVSRADVPRFLTALSEYCQNRRNPVLRRKRASFDLAILVNPKEALPPSNEAALKQFVRAAERQNMRAEIIAPANLDRLDHFDALFIRETTNIENHTFTFARHAEANGMPVIDDPVSILRCSNKVYLAEAMARARIATPATTLVTRGNVGDLARKFSYPLVLKVPDGSFSRGVVKVGDPGEFLRRAEAMLKDTYIILAQEFLPTAFDWRIGVLDGRPLFACKYMMVKGHWQVYKHKADGKALDGPSVTMPVEQAPPDIVKTAVRASLQMGRGLYGVDLKEVNGVPYVIEVNDNPNVDAGIEDDATGDAVYDAIMAVFRKRILATKNLLPARSPAAAVAA